MIEYVTLGTLPPAPEPAPDYNFQIGDRVVRKNGKQTVGIIRQISRGRATVMWQNANARRLGAVSPHKIGRIRLASLRLSD